MLSINYRFDDDSQFWDDFMLFERTFRTTSDRPSAAGGDRVNEDMAAALAREEASVEADFFNETQKATSAKGARALISSRQMRSSK